VDILGKSLLKHVWDKCTEASHQNNIYVATDDSRIEKHCHEQGMKVIMTSPDCLTGTDRVFEASQQINSDFFINVQGDEPLIKPDDIKKMISSISFIDKTTLINAQCKINDEKDFFNPNIPKTITDLDGKLLYISRAPIPFNKDKKFIHAKKQVCIYGFSKQQLSTFYNRRTKTPIELIEDIEVLRFLELGFQIKMIDVSSSSVAVDVPSDAEYVKKLILSNKE
jgi:3-deoxy-manno-octulosonate cytidylyltransferase (CMP-KDO synthetase)